MEHIIQVPPGQSLAAALQKAAERESAEIHLQESWYHLATPLRLDRQALGRCKRLTVRGSGRGKTLLTGCVPLHCEWRPWREGVLVAEVPKGLPIDALYANGMRQVLARYPNLTPGATLGGYSADALAPERVVRWENPAGGYIRALHHAEWGGNSYIIDGKDGNGRLLYHWVGDNNRGDKMHPIKRMVENILEELDEPGEWYYDREGGLLYFWPPQGLDAATARFEAAVNPCLFHIEGEGHDVPLCDIHFTGFTVCNTPRTLFTGTYERPLRGDWGMVRNGALFAQNARGIQIEDVAFDDIGGNAVTFSGYNSGHMISRCEFTHIGATGVLVMGQLSAVRDASCYDGDNHKTVISDFVPGPRDENYPRDILVADSYFYDIGCWEKQTAAVCMSISHGVTVRGCTVHHTSRAGINIHDGTFGGHVLEDNDLFDCVRETADHGPINCWGRDRYWSVPQHDAMGYYGREKRPFALLDATDTTVIRHNRVHANYAFGIDIDDGASNYDITNNLCIGVGIKLRDGFDRRVHNNLLVGAGFELHMSFAQNNDILSTNLVCNRRICNALCVNEGATTISTHNLYWAPNGEVASLPPGDYAPFTGDPLFEDFAGGDYRLKPASPALQHGFVPFPVSDEDFGLPDRPKPPKFAYTAADTKEGLYYHDVLLYTANDEGIRSAAGLPDLKGAYVAERDVLGIFCKLGLPIGTGDVVRGVAGQPVDTAEDFVRLFEELPLNTPVSIDFYRSQRPHHITFIRQPADARPIAEEAEEAWQGGKPMLYKE